MYRPTYILEQYDRQTDEKKFYTGLISRNALEWAEKLGTRRDGDTLIIRRNNGEPLSGAIWENIGQFYRRARKDEIQYLFEKWKFEKEQTRLKEVMKVEKFTEDRRKMWESGFFA